MVMIQNVVSIACRNLDRYLELPSNTFTKYPKILQTVCRSFFSKIVIDYELKIKIKHGIFKEATVELCM